MSNEKNFVDRALSDRDSLVVLFSLSWCSYCHAMKQLLQQLGLIYKEYTLDRGEFLERELEKEVRSRLQELTSSSTLPQLFIKGESVGGFTDTYAALQNGNLKTLLDKHGILCRLN